MNYSLTDLEHLELKKELFNGYNRAQVEKILSKVKEDYYELLQANSDLQNEVSIMKETVQHYKTIEESLQHTLIIAHSTGESIKLNATEKASNIIREAENKAKKIIDEAELQVIKIKNEYEEIKSSLNNYKLKTQSLLNTLQDLLKTPFEESAE
ncbi:MAG: DivIVA domain-containing protein [Burkholderiales bacterium]